MKRIYKTILLVSIFTVSVFCANAQNKSYITNHKLMAAILSAQYGIPAPVILSVAAIESSGGMAPTARVLNNHFGMVGKNTFVNHKGKKSRYKQYSNELASYVDFCKVISRKHFYSRLKDNDDCKVWIKAISRCGYSEQPVQWEQKVFSVLSTIRQEPILGLISFASAK